jgi:hypothetical protein
VQVAGVTFAFPHKHPTFPLASDWRRLLRRASASAPQHYYLADERKRLMPNACCGRLIPRSHKERDARWLHFCLVSPHFAPQLFVKQSEWGAKREARCCDVTYYALLCSCVRFVLCSQDDRVRECVCVRWQRCWRCCNEIRRRTHSGLMHQDSVVAMVTPAGESLLHGIINILL